MGKDVRIAGKRRISIGAASKALAEYPSGTLEEYDARAIRPPAQWRTFSKADIEATRVIETRALRDPVADVVLRARLPWRGMPDASIDIADLSPDGDTYESLCQFWVALLEIHGVGSAIASKLMYLKWPRATIIQDSLVKREYDAYAREVGEEICSGPLADTAQRRRWTRFYTFAFQRDVEDNRARGVFDAIREDLARSTNDDPVKDTLLELPDLRLLDMLVWKVAKQGR